MSIDSPPPFLTGLLLLILTGCNDGGIVGTGTGEDANTPQLASDTTTPEGIATGAATSFPASIEAQQRLCAALPREIASELAGTVVTAPAAWKQEGEQAFSCRWVTRMETGEARVSVIIDSNPAFGEKIVANTDGRYGSASASVLNNGYEINADICSNGIVIPVDENLWVTVSRENREACEAGTDRKPGIEALNRMGSAVISLLGFRKEQTEAASAGQ